MTAAHGVSTALATLATGNVTASVPRHRAVSARDIVTVSTKSAVMRGCLRVPREFPMGRT